MTKTGYMEIEDITKEQEELKFKGFEIENGLIKSFELNIDRHYRMSNIDLNLNCATLSIPIAPQYATRHTIIPLLNFLDIETRDCINISKIPQSPCKIVIKSGKVEGLGNFLNDKYILKDDLLKYANHNTVLEIARLLNR